MEVVQDTNVFVAALRSQEGASAEVLDRCPTHEDQAVMGAVPLAEYEELVQRESLWRVVPVTAAERETLLDDFCAAANRFTSAGGPICRMRMTTLFWNWRLPVAWNIWSRTTRAILAVAN